MIDLARRRYREAILAAGPAPGARDWRFSLFERGVKIADELEARLGPLAGKRILDVGTAFGGDAAALYARGVKCVGVDRCDHGYRDLKRHLRADGGLHFLQSDCQCLWPFADGTFDVVISIAVIEHLDDLDWFFSELIRVLKPDGCALIDTPVVLPMTRRDAHYQLPLVGVLPTPARRWVAERIFRRHYDLRLSNRTFYSAGAIKRHVARLGWRTLPRKFKDSPIMARASRWPLAKLWQHLIRYFAFDFVLVVPPRQAH